VVDAEATEHAMVFLHRASGFARTERFGAERAESIDAGCAPLALFLHVLLPEDEVIFSPRVARTAWIVLMAIR
jgi:hypothetical protein